MRPIVTIRTAGEHDRSPGSPVYREASWRRLSGGVADAESAIAAARAANQH